MQKFEREEMINRINTSKIGLATIGDVQTMNADCNGIGIILDNKPLLVIGSWDLEVCQAVVSELVASDAFRYLLNEVLNLKIHSVSKELSIVKYSYSKITQKNVMTLMIKDSQTGQVTDPRIYTSPIIGFILSSEYYSDKRMAVTLCIVPELENIIFKLKDTIGMRICA